MGRAGPPCCSAAAGRGFDRRRRWSGARRDQDGNRDDEAEGDPADEGRPGGSIDRAECLVGVGVVVVAVILAVVGGTMRLVGDVPGMLLRVLGHRGQVKGYAAGGKTGTTLVSIPTGYALDSTLATFVGFAPVEDPALIMLVKIDEPKDDPLGGIVAAPVFGKLAPQILSYLNVRPTTQVAQAR